ncbi:bifunctional 2-polyprenyl-6-hydroxyphenol methylase/3-demethylubiquinol 3-O-methyltransferase UbiG [Stella sp.]|uniref:bifunctional 2-polyprenyl-6-hydroxyphenol methylase/3-demethylubiquinol 3-O-methyltransferase UbiG n=1 Tax=Stella sp. TaxID=2912054 RepID=UPI0035ADA71D
MAAATRGKGDPGSKRPLATSTVDPAEIQRFAAIAEEWWDPDGKFRPLHRFNPVRLEWLRDRIAARFGRDPAGIRPLAGLRLLDIGCGGGLLAEPMARLGAEVTGIDAAQRNVEVARIHAERMGLAIDYRFATAEELVAEGRRFDVVLNMEVVEHVADRDAFLDAAAALVAPGGLMAVATLNRTPKAWLLAILGAEYVLGWLPRGTHEWRKFVRPSEIVGPLRRNGLAVEAMTGVAYDPLRQRWSLAPRDLGVNYMLAAVRPPDAPA